jgi:hypothetical protein
MKKTQTIFLAVLFLFSLAFPEQHVVVDDLQVIDNVLCLSYHISELLNEKSIEALQRGIKSEVVHTIQLWQQKGFINPLIKQIDYRIKVYWDSWEKKYRLETDEENRLTPHIETVEQKCSFVENFPLAELNELERNKEYHLSLEVTFQLISAESYNAISDIFAGGEKEGENVQKKKGGFVGVFVNLLGFGDKEFSLKTKNFILNDSGQVEFVQ